IIGKNLNIRNIRDHYTILRMLGTGAFSQVYSGVCKNTSKKVAVKIIDKTSRNYDQRMVNNELEVLSLIDNNNLIKFIEYFEDHKSMYIITEHVSGGDLNSYLYKTKSILSEDDVKLIVRQIGNG